jgi:murein DD-endopeptidase MepM/ murein hydrolase activator NlpD
MNARKVRIRSVAFMMVIGVMVVLFLFLSQQHVQAPESQGGIVEKPKRVMVDFHMNDLTHGWVRYNDGAIVTADGGAHWVDSNAEQLDPSTDEKLSWLQGTQQQSAPTSITLASKLYEVKKAQFLSDRIGWALLASDEGLESPLWVTVDGGITWQSKVTSDVEVVIATESARLQNRLKEAPYYADVTAAKGAIQASWKLLPDTAAPGDVVLVRHNQAGAVTWQGKDYALQPFGEGYFTYVPLSIDVKPGRYPIGDQFLTIQAKKFDTQYLKVTQQMESMKQDTARIDADQKKIDLARSVSKPEFLFKEAFIQPIEGILTTPYGFTRYVNGKYDSSHRAIDLAAKEGTPIQATNDGIVALAERLYLTGNAIYIDHGMGLFSQYAHLSELRVKTGDYVKKGDIIGLVGTTGFSTGPHLHFTFWANNVPVNPNLFFSTTPFRWGTLEAKKTAP